MALSFNLNNDYIALLPLQLEKGFLRKNIVAVSLAHMWGAYAIYPGVVRRPSSVVCRLCPP